MKKFSYFTATLFLTAFLSFASFAQTSQVTSKIVIVDTSLFFNDKVGITKIINASKQLDAEIAPKRNEIQQMVSRSQALKTELDAYQKNIQNKVPIDQKTAQAKSDEYERLMREGKFKEDEYNKWVEKRQGEVLGPIFSEVLKSLEEYIKTKGFGMVFDVSKDRDGMLIFAGEQYDITKDFVTYYNSRPATGGTTTPRPTPAPTKPPAKP